MNTLPSPARRALVVTLIAAALIGVAVGKPESGAPTAAEIGREIFLDRSLSEPAGQACISCHQPKHAFADPRPVSPGAVAGREGTRNAPTLMYAALIPPMAYEDILTPDSETFYAWEGGLFHDGRARDQFEQVQEPFFHPNEMNLPDPAALAKRLRASSYAEPLKRWVGDESWTNDERLNYHAYIALVEFLKEPMFRPFNARIDDYLAGDEDALSVAEKRGLRVFKQVGLCADCHFLTPTSWPKPVLSDYGYDNLGAPSRGAPDPGLGGHTKDPEELGQFKAPTLRNIALTAPYMHNGSIATLKEVIEFYNKRDLEPERWGPTDYPDTVNREDMGDLGLSDQQVEDLVALMDVFTDRTLLDVKDNDTFPRALPKTPTTDKVRLFFPDWTHRLHPEFTGDALPPKSAP